METHHHQQQVYFLCFKSTNIYVCVYFPFLVHVIQLLHAILTAISLTLALKNALHHTSVSVNHHVFELIMAFCACGQTKCVSDNLNIPTDTCTPTTPTPTPTPTPNGKHDI